MSPGLPRFYGCNKNVRINLSPDHLQQTDTDAELDHNGSEQNVI